MGKREEEETREGRGVKKGAHRKSRRLKNSHEAIELLNYFLYSSFIFLLFTFFFFLPTQKKGKKNT